MLSVFETLSQSDNTIRYIPKNEFSDTMKVYCNPFCDTIFSTRVYNIDSSFSDSQLLCSAKDEDCSLSFKIDKNKDWNIGINNNWVKFYFDSLTDCRDVSSNDSIFTIVFDDVRFYNQNKIFCFYIRYNFVTVSEVSRLWFNPLFGIIALESSRFVYIRQDFIPDFYNYSSKQTSPPPSDNHYPSKPKYPNTPPTR